MFPTAAIAAAYGASADLPSATPGGWRTQFGADLAAFQKVEREFDAEREAPYTYLVAPDPVTGALRKTAVAPAAGVVNTPLGAVPRDALLLGGLVLAALLFSR